MVIIVSLDRRVSDVSNEGSHVEIDGVDVVVEASEVTGVGAPRAPKRGSYLSDGCNRAGASRSTSARHNRPFLFRKDFGIVRPFLIWRQLITRSYWVTFDVCRAFLSGCTESAARLPPR